MCNGNVCLSQMKACMSTRTGRWRRTWCYNGESCQRQWVSIHTSVLARLLHQSCWNIVYSAYLILLDRQCTWCLQFHLQYSGPSISGHSQRGPPTLPLVPSKYFASPSRQRPPLYHGHKLLAIRVSLLQRDYCVALLIRTGHPSATKICPW